MSSESILHMRLLAPTGVINLNHVIPIQTLTLMTVRVEMVLAADAIANPVMGVELASVFGPSQINNSDTQSSRLPVFNSQTVLNQYAPQWKIGLQKEVERSFEYSVYGTNGNLIPAGDFSSIDLTFGYSDGEITG